MAWTGDPPMTHRERIAYERGRLDGEASAVSDPVRTRDTLSDAAAIAATARAAVLEEAAQVCEAQADYECGVACAWESGSLGWTKHMSANVALLRIATRIRALATPGMGGGN